MTIVLLFLVASTFTERAFASPAEDLDRGQVLFKKGEYERAEPLLAGALAAIDAGRLSEEQYLARCLKPLMTIYCETGRYEQALPLAERRKAWLDAKGADADAKRENLVTLGRIYAALGRTTEAIAIYRPVLASLRMQPRHRDTFVVAVQIAACEYADKQYEEAIRLLSECLQDATLPAGDDLRAQAYLQLGRAYVATGDRRRATAGFRQASAIDSATLKKPAGLSEAARLQLQQRLREAYTETGQFAGAADAARAVLQITSTRLGPNANETRIAQDELGMILAAAGDYAQALPLLVARRARLRDNETTPPDALAQACNHVGFVCRKLGRNEEAEASFQEALVWLRRTAAPNALLLAETQGNLAIVLGGRGLYAQSIAQLQVAIAMAEQEGPAGDAVRSGLEQSLAQAYLAQGQRDRAAEHLRTALELQTRSVDRDPSPASSRTLVERYEALALLELSRGDTAAAGTATTQALALIEQSGLRQDPLTASLERLQGRIAFAQRQWQRAERSWLAALAAQQSQHAVVEAARTLSDLGNLAVRRRKFDQAENYYRQALAQQADVHSYPILHYNILGNLGQVIYYGKGNHEEGLKYLKQAADLLEIPRAATSGGGEGQRAEFLARHATAFDLLVDGSIAAGKLNEAFHYAERARNRTFLDQMQLAGVDLRATLVGGNAAALLEREHTLSDQLTTLRNDAVAAARQRPNSPEAKALAEQVRALQAEYSQVWGEIRDASPFYREVLAKGLQVGSLADVQRVAIAPDALMLFYVLGDFESHLLVIGHEPGDVTAYELKLPKSLQEEFRAESDWLTRDAAQRLVNQFAASLRSVAGGRGLAGKVRAPKGLMEADRGQWVTDIVLPPAVRDGIGKRKLDHVIVVPDGALHELPLESLVIRPGDDPVFVLDVLPPIAYAPSATILLSLVERSAAPNTDAPAFLSVGDPRYDSEGDDSIAAATVAGVARDAYIDLGGRLQPLPGTFAECRKAVAAFGADHSILLLGVDATEARVRGAIVGPRFIHIAAHGLVDEQDENLFGAIALTPPLKAVSEGDDGFLALHEVYSLALQGCELAALSACQTNVGGDRPLEAGTTLARAFLAAGARRVVCSHWNVDDQAGSELVATLWEEIADYERRGERVPYAKALRDAQRRIRQRPEFESAYYWAPFVLLGPGR